MKIALSFLFVLPIFFSFPEVKVLWKSRAENVVSIIARGRNEVLEKCLKSGLEVKYRFKLQLCKKREAWFDTCKSSRVEIHRMVFDPISESYQVTIDRLGDDQEPKKVNVKEAEEAFDMLYLVEAMPLSYLARGDQRFVSSKRSYISTRVQAKCIGEYNETLSNIAYYLTFGIVDASDFDSGWDAFSLRDKSTRRRYLER
ncbi:DUF4390 domain-containing protein [Oligoflexia bacterium]|nr:DUF4390 domain-containing protein [Oligoflexia bacterium]